MESSHRFQHRPAKKEKAAAVVFVVPHAAVRRAVLVERGTGLRIISLIEMLMLDEDNRNLRMGQIRLPQAARGILVSEPGIDRHVQWLQERTGFPGRTVERRDHEHLMTAMGQGRR